MTIPTTVTMFGGPLDGTVRTVDARARYLECHEYQEHAFGLLARGKYERIGDAMFYCGSTPVVWTDDD